MRVQIQILKETNEETLSKMYINNEFICYILEDQFRVEKVKGDTRIPEGVYKVELRTEGSHHERYLKKFGAEFHKGMIHLLDVPNFQYILMHIGNTDSDTAGCLLNGTGFIESSGIITLTNSTDAYKKAYAIIRDKILSGEEVYFEMIRK